MSATKPYHRIGTVGRFKPLHNGGVALLEALCDQAEEVIIGIGSCNKYDHRNPFTAEETKEMIDAFLKTSFSNYSFRFIPDYGHLPQYKDGQRWKDEIKVQFGDIDLFVSGDQYVLKLLQDVYSVQESYLLVPEEKRIPCRGTHVRREMAKGDGWKPFVPLEVAKYLEEHKLIARFRKEFGLETIAEILQQPDALHSENAEEEYRHVREG